ncbi:MAG: hypothetical protein HYV02_00545 [Deltaproteobacteria bacterium]|nr:hypothetical protein [Deltaproteobacteria bacterium]
MTRALGGLPGTEKSADIALDLELSLPDEEAVVPVKLRAEGTVRYALSGPVARVRGEDLPPFSGTWQKPGEPETSARPYTITVRGVPTSVIEISWGEGRDITVRGLSLVGTISQGKETIATVTQEGIPLTTGSLQVAGQTVRGKIDIARQRVTLVGSVPMPEIGVLSIDRRFAGRPVLIRLRASPLLEGLTYPAAPPPGTSSSTRFAGARTRSSPHPPPAAKPLEPPLQRRGAAGSWGPGRQSGECRAQANPPSRVPRAGARGAPPAVR